MGLREDSLRRLSLSPFLPVPPQSLQGPDVVLREMTPTGFAEFAGDGFGRGVGPLKGLPAGLTASALRFGMTAISPRGQDQNLGFEGSVRENPVADPIRGAQH